MVGLYTQTVKTFKINFMEINNVQEYEKVLEELEALIQIGFDNHNQKQEDRADILTDAIHNYEKENNILNY